jgi:hypothetical protein
MDVADFLAASDMKFAFHCVVTMGVDLIKTEAGEWV